MVVARDPSALLTEGLAAHQAGQLEVAERCYRRVLQDAPRQPDALHLLGVAALQTGRLTEAETTIRQALAVTPQQASFWNSLGAVQRTQGRLPEAEASFERAVTLAPAYAEGWGNLVAVREARGDVAGEAAALKRLTDLQPTQARAWGRRGILAAEAGDLDAAAALLERAAALAPDDPEIWSSLGTIQLRLGRLEDAETSQRQALALQPNAPTILNNLGAVLVSREQWTEAAALLERATRLAPDDANAWTNLGHALKGLTRSEEAAAAYERTLALRPDEPIALVGLGDALQGARRLDEAVAAYHRALARRPDDAETYEHLGIALQRLGQLPAAVAAYRQSLSLAPDRPAVHSGLIFALDLLEGAEAEGLDERKHWNARFGRPCHVASHTNDPDPDRPLRVGYVSADFLGHSARFITLPIVQSHDPARVTTVCYSGVTAPDAITAQFQAAAGLWRDVARLSDDELEALIRADGIDVLVDLSGHSAGNRLPVFARRPAPVQVTAWGYATGTGLDAMDYFLADPIVVPPEARRTYTEDVIDLPNVVCYAPPQDVPPVAPAPVTARGYITFGAFNRLAKVSAGSVEAWARALQAVPDARLIVKTGSQDSYEARHRLHDDLVALGVARERVEVRGGTSQLEHLAAHADIDLMLDTFPHVGGITTLEAFLMGVPTVTLLGERVAGRLTASFLATLGLDGFVARTLDEYVAIAAGLAGRSEWLASQRPTFRDRLLTSVIGDARRYTAAVEDVFHALWRRWCEQS
jgi:protein O-GlcNAc transferase